MDLTFLGAASTVTGSKYLVETSGRRVLVDCGLFQGLKSLRLRNWAPPGFDPRSIDAVVLTHAHLDHSGYLPVLVREGFGGPIHCTAPTADLCEILLRDAGRLQEEDARFANRHGFSKHHPALPLFTEDDARRVLPQLRPHGWHQPVDLGAGVAATLFRAGHMLGAASVLLEDHETTVLFSGDVGRPDDLLLPAPEALPGADVLVIESTYGNRLHDRTDTEASLAEVVVRTAHRGGVVVIPSFCVGRAQQVLWHLRRLKDRGAIPDLPVFLDSPMATAASRLYCQHSQELRLPHAACERLCDTPRYVRDAEESKEIDRLNGPFIVIAGSGMATGGRILHHLKVFAPGHRNTIVLVGYQAVATRGARLAAGERTVRIHGEDVPVRAEVVQVDSLSAHADWRELLQWVDGFAQPPARVFVTHGEPDAAQALAQRLSERRTAEVIVPQLGNRHSLSPGHRHGARTIPLREAQPQPCRPPAKTMP